MVVRYVQKVCECDEESAKALLEVVFNNLAVAGELFKKHETKECYQIEASKYVVKNYKNESKTGIKSAFKSAFTFNSDKSTVNGLSTTQKISYLERATNLSINGLKNKSGSIGSDNVFRSLLKTYGLDTDSTDQEVTTIIQNMKADLLTYQAEVDEAMKGIKTKANAYFIYNSDYDNLNDEQINQISSLIDKALTEEIADTFNKILISIVNLYKKLLMVSRIIKRVFLMHISL